MKRFWLLPLFLSLSSTGFGRIDPSVLSSFTWRSVGPAGAGGRVVDIDVSGGSPRHVFVAFATGGLWRSSNQGVTWESLFDTVRAPSIGAVAVQQDNPDVLWVGSGEANPRNSVSWGDGVYKSTDGGKSWSSMGLRDSHHIGRIVIDPVDPDTVYVAALGHIWASNEERGLYKTEDGGLTWTKSLEIDADTGVIDVAMDPRDRRTLYAAAYEVRRDGFSGGDPAKMTGPGSAIYKSSDGGRHWKKLEKGLPKGALGRVGLSVSRSDPAIVYAIVQTGTTVPPESTDPDAPPPPEREKTLEDGGVFRSADRGGSWTWVNAINPRPFYYSQIRVDPNDPDRVYVLGGSIARSEDGGKSFENLRINVHVDHHDLWIDPANSDRLVVGNDGGIYFSFDRGASWDFLNQIAVSQFYAIDVDMQKPYTIYGGVQDYCSWGGPSATRNAIGITADDWTKVMTGDGFQVRVDPTEPNILYAEAQYGRIVRHERSSGLNTSITPEAPEGEEDYRFNWETPLHVSTHDPKTIYAGGNHLFRSRDRGNSWEAASPELTTATREPFEGEDGPQKVASMTAFAESPLDAGLLYAGTDDGHVHVTTDGGTSWTEITDRFPGLEGRRWVSRLVASRFERDKAYAAFDGHRNDDFAPHVYVTKDAGRSWTSIASNLPDDGPVRVIREDVTSSSLLFLGTELGAFVSLDAGGTWSPLGNGMPTVPVADLVVHPRDRDLVAGTHGRSAYVMDIGPLQELTAEVMRSDLHLFSVENAVLFRYRVYSDDQFLGEKRFVAANPPYGATISYLVGETLASGQSEGAEAKARIVIEDASGKLVRELEGPLEAGIRRVQWDLRYPAPSKKEEEGDGFRRPLAGPLAEPGVYHVRLEVGDRSESTTLTVEPDPELAVTESARQARRTSVERLFALHEEAFTTAERSRALADAVKAYGKEHASIPDAVNEPLDALEADTAAFAHRAERTRELSADLYREVEDSPFEPTETQRRRIEELTERHGNEETELSTLARERLASIERLLDENDVPRIRWEREEAEP